MLKQVLLLVAGLVFASASSAEQAATPPAAHWEAGKHYFVIDPPQPTSSGDKVEVAEVFSYACPHCAHFQPYVAKLKASLPDGAAMAYVPAVFNAQWVPYARAFFAAKAMGVLDKTHQALFDALHRDRRPLRSLEDLAGFYAEQGVDSKEFLSTAQSFLVENQMARAVDWARKAGVRATPSIIVNGKYRATAESAGGADNLIKLVDWLVAKELAAAPKAS